MQFPDLVCGRFVRRDNRFVTTVQIDNELHAAHMANPGRMRELLDPGCRVWLAPVHSTTRRTAYDLVLIEYGGIPVSVDSRLPNRLFYEALSDGLDLGRHYPQIETEVVRGQSRLDFRLTGPAGVCWVEVKSVTLVENRVALFPDAPTVRGRRHLGELEEIVAAGQRALTVFVIQRPDADCFTPNRRTDPDFARALARAARAGVEVRAYTCDVSPRAIAIARRIAVVDLVA
ncbi:MAG TPA: DNA/RNA nuclease SfsA [Chloroflexi bacterium]|jgi:sugar fermentation stimulation protein A|nr:DNA/RNA nuclease SfsA [Chloroflexota bacterium]